MGVDACIYVKIKEGCTFDSSYLDGTVSLIKYYPGCNIYDVECYQRYYDENSGRGYWPIICKHLVALLGDSDVESVYYFPDSIAFDEAKVFTVEDLNKINIEYVKSSRDKR